MATSSKLPMILRINREGEFIATHETTPNQCGSVGARRYRFFCTIEASNKRLTPEGFVMENAWTADYFRDRYEIEKVPVSSCEQIAQEAVEHFRRMFLNEQDLIGIDLRRIYIRIHGSDFSFIEAEWNAKPV